MKKKNWLMTLAFAVMALTIVSTCVIGSTYAKFTTRLSGAGTAQAAGFEVGTASALTFSSAMIKPGKTLTDTATVTYFAQVATVITTSELTVGGTGGLATFATDRGSYNTTHANDGYAVGDLNLDDIFEVTIGSGTGTLAEDFAAAVRIAVSDGTSTGAKVAAMAANAGAAVNVDLTINVKWKDNYITTSTWVKDGAIVESSTAGATEVTAAQKIDAFDTYIGNLIKAYAVANSGTASNVTVSIPITVSQDTTVA